MIDDSGARITDTTLLARVREVGAVIVRRESVESTDFRTWREHLRRTAAEAGVRIHTRREGEAIVVSDPDHVVDRARLRASADAATDSHPQWHPHPRV